MKSSKILGFLLSAAITVSAISGMVLPGVFAEGSRFQAEEPTENIDTTFVTEKYEQSADDLYLYGLFTPDGNEGYNIEKAVTKSEASVMLIKLLGGTAEAIEGNYESSYEDISDTVGKYVSYLDANGLNQAVSDTEFGAEEEISSADYVGMILQTTGYEVEKDAEDTEILSSAVDAGLLNEEEALAFETLELDRGAMCYISSKALDMNYSGTNTALITDLCDKGCLRWMEAPTDEIRNGVGDDVSAADDGSDQGTLNTSNTGAVGVRASILETAAKYMGVPYRSAGKSPDGFDCSGFVGYVMIETGLWDQFYGSCNDIINQCTIIPQEEAQPGDLVFFSGTTSKSGYSHMGIYIGGGQVIHCASSKGVSVSDFTEGYWSNHYACIARPNVLM